MLKEHSSFVKQGVALLDVALILSAYALSYNVVALYRVLLPSLDYWLMVSGFLGFYLYFAWTRSLFSVLEFTWMHNLLRRVTAIFVTAGVLGAAILYLLPDETHSRYLYLTFSVISYIFIATEKLCIKAVVASIRRHNRNITPVIVFGRGRQMSQIVKEIETHPEQGFRIVKKIDLSMPPHRFEAVLKNRYVEEVIFSIPRSLSSGRFSVDPYLQICEAMGRPARVFLNISSATNFAFWEYHRFMDRPSLISHTVELDPDQLLFKRLFDIAGSLAGIFILALVYPVCSVLIKMGSPGPIFFRQVRVGKNGKRFVLHKFRSMYADAEERKLDLAEKNEMSGAVFKIKDDPRITPVGKTLRKLSIDELPQFVNVFKGDMSLVGTRPPTPEEVASYQKWHHRRISIRPGMTGLWQVSGRNKISDFDEIVRLDLQYIDSWSIWLDIKIIFRTIMVVCARGDAY